MAGAGASSLSRTLRLEGMWGSSGPPWHVPAEETGPGRKGLFLVPEEVG